LTSIVMQNWVRGPHSTVGIEQNVAEPADAPNSHPVGRSGCWSGGFFGVLIGDPF